MYSVVGLDGQVYGPVDVTTLQEWSVQGRVNAKTNLIDPIDGRVLSADLLPELRSIFFVAPPIIAEPHSRVVGMAPPNAESPAYTTPPSAMVSERPMTYTPVQQAASFQQGVPGSPSVQVNNYIAMNNQTAVVTTLQGNKSKTTAILLCIFLGGLGIHRYYLGRNGSATAMLLITVLSAGYLGVVSGIWAIVDLIQLCTGSLKDSDERALV